MTDQQLQSFRLATAAAVLSRNRLVHVSTMGAAWPRLMLTIGGLMLMALFCACRGGGDGQAETVRVEPAPTHAGFVVSREELQTTGTLLRLRWSGAEIPVESPEPLALCLPAGLEITPRWLDASLGGKPVKLGRTQSPAARQKAPVRPPLNASAGTLDFAGMMRRWPIWRLRPNEDVYDLLRKNKVAGGAADLELTLELKWRVAPGQKIPSPPAPSLSPAAAESPSAQSWRRVAAGIVLNPKGLDAYEQPTAPAPKDSANQISEKPTGPLAHGGAGQAWARLAADRDGLVRLDPDELIKAGFPAAQVRSEAVRIYSHGRPVPLLLVPGPLAPAGAKPGVYFWAGRGRGIYCAERAYWVTLDEKAPACLLAPTTQTLALKPGATAPQPLALIERTARHEKDNQLQTRTGNFLAIEGIEWVEAALEPGHPLNVGIECPHFVARNRPLHGQIEFFIDRENTLSHARVEVRAAGQPVASFGFSSQLDQKKAIILPESCLRDERTTLTLRLIEDRVTSATEPGEGSIWFHRAEITYGARPTPDGGRLSLGADELTTRTGWLALEPLAADPAAQWLALHLGAAGQPFDLWPLASAPDGRKNLVWQAVKGERTELVDLRTVPDAPPLLPVQLDNLADENQGADLIVICHHEFADAARRLADFHQQAGWNVRLVDVQSIYDAFSDGELSPLAIKAFLGYTQRHWRKGAPGHVLLVGDCKSDYLNVTRNEVHNWVPTYTFTNGPDQWASDTWFSTVSGDDDLADLIVGRLSVANRKDADAVVDKILDYAGQGPDAGTLKPGPWRARLGYVADDGEFPEVVEEIRKHDTPPAYGAEKVYLNELPLEDNWYLPKSYVERKQAKVSHTATEQILAMFQKGVTYLDYYGHGSPNIWADERIWFGGDSPNSDNQRLAGSGQYTFIANMTCNSGAIDYPLTPWNICITEDMMRQPKGGAIACFVPSGPGVTTIHREMSRCLRQAMFGLGLRRMGEFTTSAKLRYALDRHPKELLYMYLLLGDPLLDLQLTQRQAQFTPVRPALEPGQTRTLTLEGIEPAEGQFIAELVDESGHPLWSAEPASYRRGRVSVSMAPPTGAATGPATLRVYCWNPQGQGGDQDDLALAGRFTVERPRIELVSFALAPPEAAASKAVPTVVRLSNPTALAAQGKLEVRLLDERTSASRTVHQETVRLAPGQSRDCPVVLSEPSFKVAEARLRLSAPPDDPALPQVAYKRLLLDNAPDWCGWTLPLCALDSPDDAGPVTLKAVALVPAEGHKTYVAHLKNSAGVDVTTLTMTTQAQLPARARVANFAFAATLLARCERGSLGLCEKGSRAPLAGHGAADIPFAAIPTRQPRLRIVPGSVHQHPRRPTEGETVFVDCEVENTGNLDAEPATLELLSRPLGQGGEVLPDNMQNGHAKLPRLAPGRRASATLRWDPIKNAGKQTLQIGLITNFRDMAGPRGNQYTPVVVEALTKAQLSIEKTGAEATPEDLADHRILLKARIRNSGQTLARHVMVSFYRSGLQAPENKLGEVELNEVPGGGAGEAVFVWNFDPARDLVQGTQLPKPTVQVWLKGSTQRLSSLAE